MRGSSSEDLLGWSALGNWIAFAIRSPLRHRALSLCAIAAALAIGILAAVLVPPRYQVNATVLARPAAFTGALSTPVNKEAEAPTRDAHEVVLRRENLMAIANKVDFVDRYIASRPRGVRLKDWLMTRIHGQTRDREALLESLVDGIESKLQVWPTPNGGVVTLGFQWWDPELAFDVVDAAVQSFIDARHAAEIKSVGEAVSILETHQARVEAEIAESVDRLEQKEKELRARPSTRRPATAAAPAAAPAPAAPAPAGPVAADMDLARMQSELTARRRAIADLETYRQQRIADLQSELAKEQAVYTPDHPVVQSTQRMLDGLATPSEQVGALRAEVEELEQKITAHGGRVPVAGASGGAGRRDEIEEARERLEGGDPRLEFDRKQLSYLLKEYAELHSRVDSARLEMETAESEFQHRYSVIEPPELPRGPMKPYTLLFVVGGLAGGLGLAFFLSTAADIRQGRVLEKWQVEHELQLPVLAVVRRDLPPGSSS